MWNGKYCCRHFGKYSQQQSFQLWAALRDSSVDLRKAISKSREISFLYRPIKSNIALYIVYKVQYGLLDFAKGLVLTQENDNAKNLLFRLEVALFRCIDLALTEQAPQFQGPSSVLECCQVVRVSLPFHGGNAQAHVSSTQGPEHSSLRLR